MARSTHCPVLDRRSHLANPPRAPSRRNVPIRVPPLATAEAIHACHAVRYDAVYVRRLCHPLNLSQLAAVQRYAAEMCHHDAALGSHSHLPDHMHIPCAHPAAPSGKTRERLCSDEEVVVLMSRAQREGYLPRLTCWSTAERFLTTRLIADMFCAAEAALGEGHTYLAATPDEQLLFRVQELLHSNPFRGDHGRSAPRSSLSSCVLGRSGTPAPKGLLSVR